MNKHIKKIDDVKRYPIHVKCSNCRDEYIDEIPLGVEVTDRACRNCLCESLYRSH